uniref:Uncharacterized protein n=1 Tax=Rhizophora mucronata TaxID=61149 RepID=A0A2P2N897_RHIMU
MFCLDIENRDLEHFEQIFIALIETGDVSSNV